MCCVVYDFFTLENLSKIAQIIIATGAVVSIRQIIKNKKKDEAMLNTIEKQKQFYEMQIAEKKKQQKEKEKQERFEKMLRFSIKIIFKIYSQSNNDNVDIEFDTHKCKKTNFFKDNQNELSIYWKVIYKIYFLKIDLFGRRKFFSHCVDYYYFVLNNEDTPRDEILEQFYNLINIDGKKIIDILKQELPKILTPDVFNGEKLIVKDE